jgi:hypothetical protein
MSSKKQIHKQKTKMKKTITILAASIIGVSAFAQDLTSKKGEPFLPEAKDMAISVEATPFLNYLGNFFGKTANNVSPQFNFLNNRQSVTIKYFLDAKSAVRASIRVGVRNQKDDAIFSVTTGSGASQVKTEYTDKRTITGNDVILGVGYESRRGKTRLQGYYGGDFYVGTGKSNTKYEYALALSSTSLPAVPQHINQFNGADNDVIDKTGGREFTVGLRGFIGAEYFIIPKLSIGGEFGWGLARTSQAKGIENTETLDVNNAIFKETTNTGGSTFFGLDTDQQNTLGLGNVGLKMTLHF